MKYHSVFAIGSTSASVAAMWKGTSAINIRQVIAIKKWWTIERNVGVTEIEVGKSVQLAAEGYWSVLNGANCNYAIKHGEEYSYSITKCKITSNQAKSLSNKIN